MALSRLELVSNHGDQTLSRIRFVAHGTSSATETYSVEDAGLIFAEGQPVVTTNLIHAHDWTKNLPSKNQPYDISSDVGEPGSVLLFAMPQDFHLGYGIFTTAYIDRAIRRVTGTPLRYAGSRNQLALYVSSDTEAQRIHIESEVANGYLLDQHKQMSLEKRYLIGKFGRQPGFDSLLSELDVSVRSLKPVNFDLIERDLTSLFQVSEPANVVLVPPLMRDIIVGTIESMLISRLRFMRWQGLGLLGYTFYEGNRLVDIPAVKDLGEQRRRMDELGRQLASSSIFTAEIAWLKTYVAHELELMRVELEAADLDRMVD